MPYKDKAKEKEQKAIYRALYPDKVKAWKAAYRKTHQKEIKAYSTTHRKEKNIRAKKYRIIHRGKIKAQNAAWMAAHPKKMKAWRRAWKMAHPEKVREHSQRRRARKLNAPVNDFTVCQWQGMQAAYDYRCAYCHKRRKGKLTQDHVIPLSKGGSHTLTNIVPSCISCNCRKQSGPVIAPVQTLMF